ncbi:MSMEG_0568 family radical SAM protein [Pelagicoccus sp. SDUM812003]|uniref:MSMEG_0568 family radical SAM protein n=1 Tax=Pelagicoccus sp. SDUM812003 TaxID=3041267 RepID=UPI00280C91B0|nr:MSMEG_0568 family radical SAM protein [Pelagicoccus sp. SDUM812003]MDQ8202174.1 MSMEG_0568 family radical SAM protein [Pelagicoccus sp. SDUM812003]
MKAYPNTSPYSEGIFEQKSFLLSELQSHGVRLTTDEGASSRVGGAGPTDHKAMTVLGTTIMVPVHTHAAASSPFAVGRTLSDGRVELLHQGERIAFVSYPPQPKFYSFTTDEGVPYWKIATLHSKDVLATTVLQTCIRYGDKRTKCQFCAIGESLKAGRTIPRKSPAQLAEVAAAAQRFDGIKQVVMTTGTPVTSDRGAAVLAETAQAIKDATGLPIQAQCEPPDDFAWFHRLKDAGVDTLGMHLEAWDENVRAEIMPGKAEVPVEFYLKAFRAAVAVFGRGQVSTYLLAGLGDSREGLIDASRQLIEIGVYPFVVPFVPVTGTQLENRSAPSSEFMRSVLSPIGEMLAQASMTSDKQKAGCAKCGACSSLSSFENPQSSGCSAA